MFDSLLLIFERLIKNTPLALRRFLYSDFNLDSRLTGILGARGVGKTTLMLQYIKLNFINKLSDVFYFSADHIYFESTTIYEFIEELYLTNHTTIFFIDEIHKYKNWSQELKNLYDGFPDIRIVFSGSSSLDLVKGSYDLSRRARILYLPGLSFREYLNFNHGIKLPVVFFEDLIQQKHDLNQLVGEVAGLKGLFQTYLRKGYYPFAHEAPEDYHERILRLIDKTIYEDIANFYNLRTENLSVFRKILNFLASTPPGQINVHTFSKNLSIDDKTVLNYLHYLAETNLVNLIYPSEAGNQSLRRPEKAYLNNTNIQFALEGRLSGQADLGRNRELFFIQSLVNAAHTPFYSKKGDFEAEGYIFEIGGKNKTRRQIKSLSNALLVKDDSLLSRRGEIPLLFLGFLY